MRRLLLSILSAGAALASIASCVGDDPQVPPPNTTSTPDGAAPDAATSADGASQADGGEAGCVDGTASCVDGTTLRTCKGGVDETAPCPAARPVCAAGRCAPRSCQAGAPGANVTCGAAGSDDCCASPSVVGTTFLRYNDPTLSATVSSFALDRFEVTVGRFRQFLNAGMGVKSTAPQAAAGTHPKIAASGWQPGFTSSLPDLSSDYAMRLACDAQLATWTPAAGANEAKPINCVSWYEAFAFCIWDGGRLPTEAEVSLAAVAGQNQRPYPWGAAAPDPTYAVYGCLGDGNDAGCAQGDILAVGSRSPKGDTATGQADLAGSVQEWMLDWANNPLPVPRSDCADLNAASGRAIRAGAFHEVPSQLANGRLQARTADLPQNRSPYVGIRCARDL